MLKLERSINIDTFEDYKLTEDEKIILTFLLLYTECSEKYGLNQSKSSFIYNTERLAKIFCPYMKDHHGLEYNVPEIKEKLWDVIQSFLRVFVVKDEINYSGLFIADVVISRKDSGKIIIGKMPTKILWQYVDQQKANWPLKVSELGELDHELRKN